MIEQAVFASEIIRKSRCAVWYLFTEIEDIIYTVQSPFFIQNIFTFFQSVLPRYFAEGCLSCSFVVLASWCMGQSLWI